MGGEALAPKARPSPRGRKKRPVGEGGAARRGPLPAMTKNSREPMAEMENGGGPVGAFRGPSPAPAACAQPGPEALPSHEALPGPKAQPALPLPSTCGVAEAGGFIEASIFKMEGQEGIFGKVFRLKGKMDFQAFAYGAKYHGASLVAVAKGSKELRGQAQALAKRGLPVKLVNLKKVGRVLSSSIPLRDAHWAAILAWCLQSQAGRIEEGRRGQLVELAARLRKVRALHESAANAYFALAFQSGADVTEIAGKGMGELGKSILDGAEKGLSGEEMARRLPAIADDEGAAVMDALDEAIFMASAPGEDEAFNKVRDENHRWIDATVDTYNQMLELLIECGQAKSQALLIKVAGISDFDSLPLLAELGSFFSDV